MAYILVFIGGGIGSIFRLFIGNYVQQWRPSQFPIATIIVNVLSAFILGLLLSWLATKPSGYNQYRLFFATGFCGGFSTFSMFTADLFNYIKNGFIWMAIINIIISVVACLLALWMGSFLIKH